MSHPTTVYLTPDLSARLAALSRRRRCSPSEIVRLALSAYLTRVEELAQKRAAKSVSHTTRR